MSISHIRSRLSPLTGYTLIEVVTSLIILAVLAVMLVPLATTLLDSQRASNTEADLNKVYTAIVGDPRQNTYGYLGDVGAFPASLMDLVQLPGSNPPGWNGPYLSDARIDSSTGTSMIYDSFGAPVEYFSSNPAVFPAAATDEIALISRGPDRSSTNAAANPNVAANYTGVAPTGSYAAGSGNSDNVVVPHFADNSNLADYQTLGQLNINITNFDDNSALNSIIPGCANYFDVEVASIPRNATEAWVNYSPGGASFDLVQGLYRVTVVVAGQTTPIWQEQVAITPDNMISRSITLPGINSSLTSTLVLSIANTLASGNNLQFYQGATSLGTVNAGNTANLAAANKCSRILARNTSASVNTIVDSFIMPNGPTGLARRYNTNTTCSVIVANRTYTAIAVYEDATLIGTVGKQGNKRAKTFTVRSGDTLTFKDQTNTSQTPTGSTACGGTAQF
jgi:type II secretory pathway pseudopilin PulG